MVDINIPGKDKMKMPDPGSFFGLAFTVVLILVMVVVVFSCFYQVGPEEVGVIQRFGKYDRTTDSGLRFKWPLGIEKLTLVKTERVETQDFGFRTKKAGVQTLYMSPTEARYTNLGSDTYTRKLGFSQDPFQGESLILTGDLNVADVEWTVYYRIKDAVQYLFNVRNVESTIRDISEAVMREVVGDATIDEILTFAKIEIQERAMERLQGVLDSYEAGIEITDLVLQDVNPPIEVKDAFNEVDEAKQDSQKTINQAKADFQRVIPRATGTAQKMIQEAEGYALDRVNKAKGEAEKFIVTWEAYKEAKDVTRRRLYLEMMLDILPNIDKKIILDSDTEGILPFLNLQPENKGGAV